MKSKKGVRQALPSDPATGRLKCFTCAQVANMLGVHVATVWRLAARVHDPLPTIRFGKRLTRFPREEVAAWLKRQRAER